MRVRSGGVIMRGPVGVRGKCTLRWIRWDGRLTFASTPLQKLQEQDICNLDRRRRQVSSAPCPPIQRSGDVDGAKLPSAYAACSSDPRRVDSIGCTHDTRRARAPCTRVLVPSVPDCYSAARRWSWAAVCRHHVSPNANVRAGASSPPFHGQERVCRFWAHTGGGGMGKERTGGECIAGMGGYSPQ